MTLAVTHVLVPLILLELLRNRSKKASRFFSKRHIFLVGFAGLLPDVDVILFNMAEVMGITINSEIGHRIIFHNIWIPMGFLGFFGLFYYVIPKIWKLGKKDIGKMKSFGKVFLVLFIGFSAHMLLDAIVTGNVIPFYPINDYMVDVNIIGYVENITGIPGLTLLVSLDAILLLFWLWHQEMREHIRDYF